MKYFILIILFTLKSFSFQTGDIIFIKSQTSQSQALRDATGSEWTHVGLIIDGKVAEAVGGIKLTPLKSFISRSKNNEYLVYRYPKWDEELNDKIQSYIKKYNVPYDIYFEWSNERQYCSEFIFKLFMDLYGEGVGNVQTFREMNLESESVKALIKARYKKSGKPFNYDEVIITPISIILDEKLTHIKL